MVLKRSYWGMPLPKINFNLGIPDFNIKLSIVFRGVFGLTFGIDFWNYICFLSSFQASIPVPEISFQGLRPLMNCLKILGKTDGNLSTVLLDYLEQGNKIVVGLKEITWIHNRNENLKKVVANGLEL